VGLDDNLLLHPNLPVPQVVLHDLDRATVERQVGGVVDAENGVLEIVVVAAEPPNPQANLL
jgi:hypothetical protein